MFRIKFKKGRGIPGIRRGRHRWFVVNDKDVTQYSCMPRSFETEQQAWEHAEWACGARVTMAFSYFEQHAAKRAFTS